MLTLVIELFQKVAENSSSQKCLLWFQVSSPWTSLNRFRVAQYHIAAPSFRTRLYIVSTAIEWHNQQILPCSPLWQRQKPADKLKRGIPSLFSSSVISCSLKNFRNQRASILEAALFITWTKKQQEVMRLSCPLEECAKRKRHGWNLGFNFWLCAPFNHSKRHTVRRSASESSRESWFLLSRHKNARELSRYDSDWRPNRLRGFSQSFTLTTAINRGLLTIVVTGNNWMRARCQHSFGQKLRQALCCQL